MQKSFALKNLSNDEHTSFNNARISEIHCFRLAKSEKENARSLKLIDQQTYFGSLGTCH